MAKGFKDFPPAAQAALLCLAAVFLVGVGFYFLIWPLYDQRVALGKQVDALHKENVENQAFEVKLAEYQSLIQQQEKTLDTLRTLVPDEQTTDEFLRTIFRNAGLSDVHVRTFVPQALVQREFYVEMPVALRIDGTYWSLVTFFNRLAHEQRIVSVSSVDLGSPSGGGMGNYSLVPGETVGANTTVTTYFNRPQPAGAPAAKK